MIKQYQPINTFSRKPVPAQIITYIVFIGQALTFFICMHVNYKNSAKQITILIVYIITVIAQVIITVRTSWIDPSDNIMIEYRNNEKNRRNMRVDDCLYCDICSSYVKETSRHCKVCQRCVQDFDHHCMWINNCVGSKNYNFFLAMILITLVNMLVYIVGMALLWTEEQWRNYIGQMAAIWCFSAIIIVFCILLANLVGLHIYLIAKGLTTYQFIMLQREQAKRKIEESEKNKKIQMTQNRQNTVISVKGKQQQQQQNKEIGQSNPLQEISDHQFKSENIFKTSENIDVIFVRDEGDLQHKTQKSAEEQGGERQNKFEVGQNKIEQAEVDAEQDPNSFNSKRSSSINLSQFFTRNKSLKFFIGDEIGSRPKSSLRLDKGKKQKQHLYKSLKVNDGKSQLGDTQLKTKQKNIPQSKSEISIENFKPQR